MASALNESASKMEEASTIEIEMLESQATSGHTIEHSIKDRQPTEESHHLDIEEGPNVSSNLAEESGSQGNDEVNRPIANVL